MEQAGLIVEVVPTQNVAAYWPHCVAHFKRVVESTKGELTINSIRQRLLNGESNLIAVRDGDEVVAAMTAEVKVCESDMRILMVPVIGGDRLDEWAQPFMDVLRQMKTAFACDLIRGGGREGWVRYLKQFGWQKSHVMVDLE